MKNLVFIAKGMPNLIKSAGDIRALNMLKILRNEYKMSVIASSADYGDGDVKGIGCEAYLTQDIKQILLDKKPEIVILAHWTIANRYLQIVKNTIKTKIVIDTIDVEFLRLLRKYQYNKELINESEVERVKNLELKLYKQVNQIIVTSNQDREILKSCLDNIIELPCLFSINQNYSTNEGNNCYTIGNWIHDPNVVSVIYLCEKIIPHVDCNLYIVGKHIPEKILKYANEKIVMHGVEYEIHKFLPKMNMLLAPILYGAGMNGKIGEALAFGIPVITTTLGAKPYGLEHKKNVMIADNDGAFIDSIKQVMNNENLRNLLSLRGRELMKKFTIEYWKERFLNEIKQ